MTRRDFLLAATVSPLLIGGFQFSPTPMTAKPVSTSLDLSRLLACIALVETGGDDTRIGKSGERSKYQIGEKVWDQHMRETCFCFERDCHTTLATLVAWRHSQWLHTHIGPNVFALALGWHVGLENWRTARFQLPQRYYGERVRNLYNDTTLIFT